MSQVSMTVKKTPIWMRIFGVPEWKHIKVTRYGGIAGNFEDKEVTYSDLRSLPDVGSDVKRPVTEKGLASLKQARSTRCLDEWLVLEFEKATDQPSS